MSRYVVFTLLIEPGCLRELGMELELLKTSEFFRFRFNEELLFMVFIDFRSLPLFSSELARCRFLFLREFMEEEDSLCRSLDM